MGSMKTAEGAFRDMLSNSTAFQGLVREVVAAGALGHIYPWAIPAPTDGDKHSREELQALRPFAIVRSENVLLSSSAVATFEDRGELVVILERDAPVDVVRDAQARMVAWRDVVDDIVTDLQTLTAQAPANGWPVLIGIAVEDIGVSAEDEAPTNGVFDTAYLRVQWGTQ
jgi:hypothetical protein